IEELAGAEEISEDEIVDDDDAEVLSEEDLVEATDDDEYAPLKIDAGDDDNSPSIRVNQSSDDTWESTLREVAESPPNKPLGEYDLATTTARGLAAHPAAPPDKK